MKYFIKILKTLTLAINVTKFSQFKKKHFRNPQTKFLGVIFDIPKLKIEFASAFCEEFWMFVD